MCIDLILHSYINWIKREYPTSEKQLKEALERCTRLYVDSEILRNDLRYLKVWLKYVQPLVLSLPCPLNISRLIFKRIPRILLLIWRTGALALSTLAFILQEHGKPKYD
jgi:hypothetical protein